VKATVVEGVEVGTQLPSLAVRFTRERLVRYAGASTDFNPIHYSEHFARRVGLPGVIAHGMLTMGTALRVVTNWVGDPSRVTSYFVRFTRPVVVPDDADGVEVQFNARVATIEGSLVTVSIEAICDGQKVLGAARAEVDLGLRVPHPDHESAACYAP
jgi:acyl dehydratase